MEATFIINIVASVLVMAGFTALVIPAFRFNLTENTSHYKKPETGISIVVAFRNEISNLPALYESICELHYPKHLIEWVLCNDHSEDAGKDWVLQVQKTAPFRITYCENKTEKGKKAALYMAVENTAFDTIFFTDADCILPHNILQNLNNCIQSNNAFVISGPIKYTDYASFLYKYQCMESALLMALTASAFKNKIALMANGANLCVKKSLFLEAQSKRKDLNIPGGDDIFMLEYAIQKNKDSCFYLCSTENTVTTVSENTWQNLLNQRVRWASKVRYQKNISGKLWQFLSLIFTLIYITSICLIPLIGWTTAGIMVLGKMIADMVLQIKLTPVFSYKINPLHIAAFSVVQVFIIMYVGLRSRFGGYRWKGRQH
jgi:cellulose synthase/poly-beta-1,6-N-acetylglucosamine synthase-like glycosyltransferase